MPKSLTHLDPARLVELLAAGDDNDRTDDRILAAAARTMLSVGLEAFEVDDVAASAGIGRSTVYRRFGDRNGLIAAAMAHEGRRLLTALAAAVGPAGVGTDAPDAPDDVEGAVAAAFCAGLTLARVTGLADLVRSDDRLLRLLTVDGAPLVAAAADHLAELAMQRIAGLDGDDVRRRAELLVRLAISFLVTPESALGLDGEACEAVVRRHVAPLVAASGSAGQAS